MNILLIMISGELLNIFAEPDVSFGEFMIDSRDKYICACPSGMLMALGIV